MPTVRIISLGCSRNLVDSEVVAGSLKKEGFRITKAASADLCVINTCAFIQKARDEALETILEAAEAKRAGRIKVLAVCGCLPQLYRKGLAVELPEVDIVLGTSDFPKLGSLVRARVRRSSARGIAISTTPRYLYTDRSPRIVSTPPHYAYLKIAEGCSNRCTYCIISRLRGPFRSRTIASVAAEATRLARGGVLREINLVGQDTTQYGVDRGGSRELAALLRRLASIGPGVEWLRLLYTHPAHYDDDLIGAVAEEPKICKYLDLPVQHASDRILRLMNRRTTRSSLTGLIGKLRARIPGLILRTSIIVGFPGETERDFDELLAFVREMRFDRLGAFVYSREEKTPAARMAGQVDEKVKEERLDRLMKMQQSLSLNKNRQRIGSVVKVLIDEKSPGSRGKDGYVGRTQGDAPEVDGSVYVSGPGARVGEFCDVRITDALEYDLIGTVDRDGDRVDR